MSPRIGALARLGAIAVLFLTLWPGAGRAQVQYSEDFTGTTTNNQWFFYNGACLTAGTNTSTTSPGYVPGCTTVLQSYYNVANPVTGKGADPYLVGGDNGYLGGSSPPGSPASQAPDSPPVPGNPRTGGALRFTNGYPYGYHENGAIVSNFTFPTTQGLEITFKTVTYLGDKGGSGTDGADGISFYLLDGCMPIAGGAVPTGCPPNPIYGSSGQTFPGIGAWGGSLAYTCSNVNTPYDGLVGAYLGLGIDEYGNFLNGTSNTLGETDDLYVSGDNTATGGGYKPGRIGIRGAGSISWQALTAAYGTNNGSSSPYYPASLATSCASGVYSSTTQSCETCSSGSYYGATNTCNSCPVGTFDSGTGMCDNAACAAGTLESNGQHPGQCYICPSSATLIYHSRTNTYSCSTGTLTTASPTLPAPANTSSPGQGVPYSWLAVQKTCQTGNLFNYSNASSPVSVGGATLSNPVNTASVLDYSANVGNSGSGAYFVLPSGNPIANETATLRGSTTVANSNPSTDATPITYRLKITPDNLLSLSYSYNGGAYQPVISGQSLTSSNGALPSLFRFGFAGSTGGSTNIHEVMCFKAAPAETSQSSGGINVYENPTVKFGTQLFLAYYFPLDWSGQLTAQTVGFNTSTNSVVIASTPNWDARCVLTGGTCSSTGGTSTAEAPASRTMLTWNGTQGIPFEWGNLTAAQQAMLDTGDSSQTANRLAYLRGDRTNELNSAGTCPQAGTLACFRQRNSVLGDIVDSSPTWVGPPQTYSSSVTWADKLYPSATAPESAGDSYTTFQTNEQGRLNVVYIGANDGFLHGFRAGSMDVYGNLINNAATPNDGYEVLAYMPGALLQSAASTACPPSTTDSVVQNIHGVQPVNSNCGIATASVVPSLDYSNTQYAHNWFVDATPTTGDLFYADATHPNGTWHTWLVGGLGPGGAAIYALDVTNPTSTPVSSPTNFSEGNAANIVVGEWTPSNITCVNVANCAQNLGNTYGTPLIRRFHNGSWGVIFGNGYGSQNNVTAGIFIMLIDPKTANKTFYYLATPAPTGGSPPANGIASPASLDVDSDHIIDYIYAGDLQGHVWRFDVTSQNPANWAVSASSPLFTTPGNQPITTGLTVSTLRQLQITNLAGEVIDTSKPERVIINFGTGRLIPQTVYAAAQYASGTQYLFGIWDWDMSGWNSLSTQQAVSLTGPQTITLANLQQQTVTTVTPAAPAVAYRTVTENPVCWAAYSAVDYTPPCPNPGSQFGWYMQLPATGEQMIFNPVLSPDGELVVNTYIPLQDSPLSCTAATSGTGFSMGVNPGTGAGSTTSTGGGYFSVNTNGNTVGADGLQLNGTGIPWFISSGQRGDNNSEYLITQTPNGPAPPTKTNRHMVVSGKRLYWIQRR